MILDVLLYPGFDELDAIGPYEVCHVAQRLGASWKVELVTHVPAATLIAANGVEIITRQCRVLGSPAPDLVIVLGGGWNNRSAAGAWGEYQRKAIPRLLAEHHGQGSVIASVCTGAMLLAAGGVLEGRNVTTHYRTADALRENGAAQIDARVVDDGDIITCGGVT